MIILLILLPYTTMAQRASVYDGLSVKGNVGLTTLYGDISESTSSSFGNAKFGFGFSGIKMFSSFFGVEVRFASSNLANKRIDLNEQYTGQVSEIGLSARIEPFSVIGDGGMRRVYPYARIGISNASYRAIRWNTVTNQIIEPSFGYNLDDLSNAPRENALSFPLALGVGFRLNGKVSLELEYNHSILNTDFLDTDQVTGGFNDMHGMTSIGIRYSIEPVYQSGLPRNRSFAEDESNPLLTANRRSTSSLESREEYNGPIDPFKNEIPYSNIYVESIVPDYPISGDIFEVLLRIHKGEYTGPASLVQTFPEGFTAIEAPIRNARLTFDNKQATITWNQMPLDSLITIRYHVHIDGNITGPQIVNGRIYYAQPGGNESYRFVNQFLVTNRTEMEMDQRFQSILSERKSSSNPYSTSVSVQKQRESELDSVVKDLMKNYEETGDVYPSRLNDPLIRSSNPDFEQTLVPEKDLDKKIQNLIGNLGPAFSNGSASSSVDNLINNYEQTGEIKTSSMDNPVSGNTDFEKKVLSETELDQKLQKLIGNLGPASRGGSASSSVDNLIHNFEQTGEIKTSSMKDPVSDNTDFEKKVLSETELDQKIQNLIGGGSVAGGSIAGGSIAGSTDWSSSAAPTAFVGKSGVEFKIQVGAFSHRSDYGALTRKYQIREAVSEEYNQGLYKYTVGSLSNYRQAQQYRDDFIRRTGLLSAFIVEYNNGTRISGIGHLR